ncbi:MAG: 2-aminoethylphosphonate--pyruvate transaminase [Rhodospirillales bacterium]|jgi:2-aminoethylphosphonate-pyruvate transaminase|nr:2-aminoethylphosphonate--pyruvate transaminase [Rhodospirillales bacterium]|tara:strand:- start:278 stop:1399 length:1122 start_codon:yes stop_codon:yes gene_type:complete
MNEPLLLTPGPLTTSKTVKEAMLRDWGSRDADFIDLTRGVVEDLIRIAGADPSLGTYACVPIQGSGTFAVEAAIDTLVPRDGRLLVLVNGAYGRRIVDICNYMKRATEILEFAEDEPTRVDGLSEALSNDTSITHVAAIHCETTSGILNPLEDIAEVVRASGRKLIVDAMSTFGAIDIGAEELGLSAVIASSNKCLEGVPGIGFAVIKAEDMAGAAGNATSLSLDLHDQWQNFQKSGQWRFTPPTHVLAALARAIQEFKDEGGIAGRGRRYSDNCRILMDGMAELGFEPLLDEALQAPIIVTYHAPCDENYEFGVFYDALRDKGFAIYPGKITKADSFRIGCIGRIDGDDIRRALAAISETLAEQNIVKRGPA